MTPYNNNVLIEKQSEENVSESGIIIDRAQKDKWILVKGHDELKDKQVFLKDQPTHLEGNTYSTSIDNIVAFK